VTALVGRLAPTASPVNALKPIPTPSPGAGGGVAASARKKLTRKPQVGTGAVPVLRTVNETVSGRATAMVRGAETAVISRSGRKGTTWTWASAVLPLFAAFVPSSPSPTSGTTPSGSATAERK